MLELVRRFLIIFHHWVAVTLEGNCDSMAVRHVRILARYGDPWGTYELGVRYLKGEGVDKDTNKARLCFMKVSQSRTGLASRAEFELGVIYLNGLCEEPNEREAANWFKLSAEKGFGAAQYNYGLALMDGWAGRLDVEEGRLWLEKASGIGVKEAAEALKRSERT